MRVAHATRAFAARLPLLVALTSLAVAAHAGPPGHAPLLRSAYAGFAVGTNPACAAVADLDRDGRLDVAAPFGLEDCFAMRLRPNPHRAVNLANLERVAEKLRQRWPELTLAP